MGLFIYKRTSDHWTDSLRDFIIIQKIAIIAMKINQIKQSVCGQMLLSLGVEIAGAYGGKLIANYGVTTLSKHVIQKIPSRELLITASFCAGSYFYLKGTSKAAMIGFLLFAPALLIPDIENYVGNSLYELILLVSGIASSILGGFGGLNLVGTSKTFESYKRKMIKYEITGVLFDSIIVNPNSLPAALLFKIPRQLSRS